MSLTKEQQALALASMCNTQDSERPSCPARSMFYVECPFHTSNCNIVNENDWLDILENELGREAQKYGVTVNVSLTLHRDIMALSTRTAKSRAEADILELLGEAGLMKNATVTIECDNKEDK